MSGANDVVLYQELAAQNGKKIGVATLNSEKSLNALSLPMVESLQPNHQAWQADISISMVFLQGVGEKAFCAGGYIRELKKTNQVENITLEKILSNEKIQFIGFLKAPCLLTPEMCGS